MSDVNEQFGRVEHRLDGLEQSVSGLRGDVGELRTEVRGLRGEVGELRTEVGGLRGVVGELRTEVGGLRGEAGELRLVVENHGTTLARLGDVVAHNGARLDEIVIALRPLQDMRDLLARVADNHERRIQDLEKHAGIDRS